MSTLETDRICRLCCAIKGRLRFLFEQRQEYPLPLNELIYAIADVKIDANDGLPQKICGHCVGNLLKMYKDIQRYRENDLFLKKQLNQAKPNNIEDRMEVEQISIKQEVVEEESESVLKSEPKNDTDETHDTADNKEGISAEQDICIKNEPLDEHDEESQLNVTDVNVVAKDESGPQGKRSVWKCYICRSESHETASDLLVHLNSNHKDLLPFTCSDCVMDTVVLKTLSNLNRHLRQHSYPHKCPYCDKRYQLESNLAFHIKQHHRSTKDDSDQQIPAKCDQCEKEVSSKSSLAQHIKFVHSVPTTMNCRICGAVFDNLSQLRTHLQEKNHGRKKPMHDCNICQKKYSSLRRLEIHIRTIHSNWSQKFKCSYCSKEYTTEHSKQVHEENHSRNPKYKANRNWSQYYTRVEGQEGLTSPKSKCNICGLITIRIDKHVRFAHFPEKYGCETCGKQFTRIEGLRVHLARHKRNPHSVQSSALNGEQSNVDNAKQVVVKTETDAEVDWFANKK